MTRPILTAAVLIVALAAPAAAQSIAGDWDGDGDTFLSDAEFLAGWSATDSFSRYDSNADGAIDEAEFGAFDRDDAYWNRRGAAMATFRDYDTNLDGVVDDAEYGAGWFTDYDRDRSGFLDDAERAGIDLDRAEGGLFWAE
ncbi:hypothetical protein [uncultured Jannaschia sp.]|uniref:hypothetical protein n=1 Tax=uncultured Jannaschia sp. TaxID=293347 RepID=UPI00261AD472|nr:hypothetical protein [uncultured Jannaschia sp.]